MELIDFIAWVYGISREEAILEILSLRAGTASGELSPCLFSSFIESFLRACSKRGFSPTRPALD
jgi:hypothetical protein